MRRRTETLREKLRSVALTATALAGRPKAGVSMAVFFVFASVAALTGILISHGSAGRNDTMARGSATEIESMRNGLATIDWRTDFASRLPSPFSRIVRSNAAFAASLDGFAKVKENARRNGMSNGISTTRTSANLL